CAATSGLGSGAGLASAKLIESLNAMGPQPTSRPSAANMNAGEFFARMVAICARLAVLATRQFQAWSNSAVRCVQIVVLQGLTRLRGAGGGAVRRSVNCRDVACDPRPPHPPVGPANNPAVGVTRGQAARLEQL